MHKDISHFAVGEIATSRASNISYRVDSFNYIIKGNKRMVQSSNCTDVETGNKVIITWKKNYNFK